MVIFALSSMLVIALDASVATMSEEPAVSEVSVSYCGPLPQTAALERLNVFAARPPAAGADG